jgi:hypothetical protein
MQEAREEHFTAQLLEPFIDLFTQNTDTFLF